MDKYEKVKIIYSYKEFNFDTGKVDKLIIEEKIINLDKARNFIRDLESNNDGEITYRIICIYDLFDKAPYSMQWIRG